MSAQSQLPNRQTVSGENLILLSRLVLAGDGSPAVERLKDADDTSRLAFQKLSHSHHVLVRGLRSLKTAALESGASELAGWATQGLEAEDLRIANALEFLHPICQELEAAGCPVLVMKSLDHWPDIGTDIDLYTTGSQRQTRSLLQEKFHAVALEQSWGDRLADKVSYRVPGLRASVEVHHGRLGQTGEHRLLARRFMERRLPVHVSSYEFLVPAPEERVIATTLQRMYRHLYVRICDIANTAGLIERGELDYAELRGAAEIGGVWPGVASYLKIVSDYVRQYTGKLLPLPASVLNCARLDASVLFVRGTWLRVPVFPETVSLYWRQLAAMARQGDFTGTFRLSLLPPLASAAKIACKITGTPRGIW